MMMAMITVSIPSNGSIQFLRNPEKKVSPTVLSLNPLKRVNSILTLKKISIIAVSIWSQSPQTGQFNSYSEKYDLSYLYLNLKSQSPQTGQFNSYSVGIYDKAFADLCLNPLKRVNSILTISGYCRCIVTYCLNPLKRVNSILTITPCYDVLRSAVKSQSPQTGQFNSYYQSSLSCLTLQ